MDLLVGLPHRLSTNMCVKISRDFKAEEVNVALKQMHPNKAPQPDGMPPLFYQWYWYIVGPQSRHQS